jgi:integral membrane protein (TIGR00529 family)
MLSPVLALVISIAVILVLLRFKVAAGFAVFAGAATLALLVLPLFTIPSELLQALLDYETIKLLIVISSTLTISRLMEQRGMLAGLAKALEGINPKFAIHIVPAIIGLVPMPAGAVVSGVAVRDIMKKLELDPEQGTFINYWFRHIWEYSTPVYTTTIAASVILAVPLSSVVLTMLPITILSTAAGAIVSYNILKKLPTSDSSKSSGMVLAFIQAAWPIILLVAVILIGVDAIIVFPAILLLLIIQQRPKWNELGKSFQYGLDPKVLFLSYSVMLYKMVIETSASASAVLPALQSLGLPVAVILIALPFTISMITGMSIAFVGIALPLLLPFLVSSTGLDSFALILAYTSGGMGMMLSPLHLCLVMSAEYFKANLLKVYKYMVVPSLVMMVVTVLIYLIGSSITR